MGEAGTFGDHITLQRAAQMFHTHFLIVSTLGMDATTIVSPTEGYNEDIPTLVLGHIAEGHGDHYVSLSGPVSSYIENIQEEEMLRIPASRHTAPRLPCEVEVNGGSILDIPLVSSPESPVNVSNSDIVSPVTLSVEMLELCGSRIMSLIKSMDFQFESMISFLFSDTAPSCAQIFSPHAHILCLHLNVFCFLSKCLLELKNHMPVLTFLLLAHKNVARIQMCPLRAQI